jgi:hypothetical protein
VRTHKSTTCVGTEVPRTAVGVCPQGGERSSVPQTVLKVGSRLVPVPVKRHLGEQPVLYRYRLDCDHDARETVNTQGPRFFQILVSPSAGRVM